LWVFYFRRTGQGRISLAMYDTHPEDGDSELVLQGFQCMTIFMYDKHMYDNETD